MSKLTDNSPFPLRCRYQGVAMVNIPADFLLQIRCRGGCPDQRVNDYITDNLDVLQKEVEALAKYDLPDQDEF